MKSQKLKEIKGFVARELAASPDICHKADHLRRVEKNALELTRILHLEEKLDLNLLRAACWLHDLTYLRRKLNWKSFFFESRLVEKELMKFFRLFSLPSFEKKIIKEAVIGHPLAFPLRKLNRKGTLYTQILQDADTLDGFNRQRREKLISQKGIWPRKISEIFFQYGEKNFSRYFNFPQAALELTGKRATRFHFSEWGKERKKTLICLPGYADTGQTYQELAKRIKRRYRLIGLDLPIVHGGRAPETPLSLALFLEAFIQKEKIRKFSLAGFSFGGLAAVEYASLFPEKLEKVYLFSTPPKMLMTRWGQAGYRWLRPFLTSKLFCQLYLKMELNPKIRQLARTGKMNKEKKKIMSQAPLAVFGTLLNGLDLDYCQKINELKVPVEAFFSKNDKIVRWKKYRKTIKKLNWRVRTAKDSGHGDEDKAYWRAAAELFKDE